VNAEEPARLAGELISLARRRAGLTQTELARRAGVQQSVVSAYESGRRQPTVPTLLRLIRATGQGVQFQLVGGTAGGPASDAPAIAPAISPPAPAGERRRSEPFPGRGSALSTQLGRRLRRERRAVLDTAARYGAGNVRVFGSVARGEDRPDSDVDLLVDLAADRGLLDLVGLRQNLEELLGLKVDVVPASGLRPSLKEQAEREAILL
jgi:predicted nucleotidyltransferase/DNA-binding XRE family transcriptional regulator